MVPLTPPGPLLDWQPPGVFFTLVDRTIAGFAWLFVPRLVLWLLQNPVEGPLYTTSVAYTSKEGASQTTLLRLCCYDYILPKETGHGFH